MVLTTLKTPSRLQGKSILLSTGIPEPVTLGYIPGASVAIEEAVFCLARSVFVEGGALVLGESSGFANLLSRLVGFYHLPAPAEQPRDEPVSDEHYGGWKNPSVLIYQSEVWRPHWEETGKRLEELPLVKVNWVLGTRNERVDDSLPRDSQAPFSMQSMREKMISDPSLVAMVAIGGTSNVLAEAQLFAQYHEGKPIFALSTTGGTAAALTQNSNLANRVKIVDLDQDAFESVKQFWNQQDNVYRWSPDGPENIKYYVPYSFIAQKLVESLIG
jgi:SLOG cluster3 family